MVIGWDVRILGWVTEMKPVLNCEEGYRVHLANGQGWHILATEGVGLWVSNLAAIMQLEKCVRNGYPKLIFVQKEINDETLDEPICRLSPKLVESLPSTAWKPRNLAWLRVWSHHEVPDIICEKKTQEGNDQDLLSMRMALQPIYQRVQDSGGLPLHAALVRNNGFGILLVGNRGVGKSTCCRRIPKPWHSLCDEETLIVKDHEKHYLAHPFPTWSDYLMSRSKRTWNVQSHVPLSGIFFLEQAEMDNVVDIGQGEASALLNQSAVQVSYRYWINLNNEAVRSRKKELFDNACEIAKTIQAFKLRVSLTGRFWEEIEAVVS